MRAMHPFYVPESQKRRQRSVQFDTLHGDITYVWAQLDLSYEQTVTKLQ